MAQQGINEKLDKLIKNIEDEKESKKPGRFKLPRFLRSMVGKPKFRNYALVVYLRRNREVDLKYIEIENDQIRVEDKYYDARVDCYYTYGKKRVPTLVLPEWSLRPIGTEDYQKALEKGETVDAQDITIKAHERMEAGKSKLKMDVKMIIFLVIGAIILGAFFMAKG